MTFTRTPTIAVIVLAGFVAAWGCGQTPTASTGLKSLEQRVAKLEQDLKAVEKERDAAKAQAAAAEERFKKETARAQSVEKERDEAHAKLDTFKKGLKDLLGEMEKPASTPASPSAAATFAPPRGL
jgi:outer membrane murein-binding lipoprotein Lpp